MSKAALKNARKHDGLTPQVHATIEAMDTENDPIARQYVADPQENTIDPAETSDPIGDNAHSPVKGIVHRYPDRALLKITDTCAVYCRFCFRKDMVGQGDGILEAQELNLALAYLRNTPQIREVILTGGDPLTLSNRRMSALFEQLEAIPHIDIIRIHTRAPLVTPERVDDGLIDLIAKAEKALYVVLHINHAREINEPVRVAFRKLSRSGAVLLAQSVLLRGVNDDPAVLEDLYRVLLANRVKPYYLHHPDLATGTGHFRLGIKEGQDIVAALRGRLSGLAYPHYVLDIPGGYGKMPLMPSCAHEQADGTYIIADYQGGTHAYPPKGGQK